LEYSILDVTSKFQDDLVAIEGVKLHGNYSEIHGNYSEINN
jgi:hypothetical protein